MDIDGRKYRIEFGEEDDTYSTSEMRIIRNDKEAESHQDGGEPEDQLWCRDWDWVESALLKAYQYGFEDGAIK